MKNKPEAIQSFKHYIAFLVIAIAAFWQLVFYIHPPMYDMTDCYFPWRYFIGECLQHGKLPFWNPYQNLGYPIHADPSSGAWYPVVWVIGYFFGYSVYSTGMEFCFHAFIAAIGFYTLSKTLNLSSGTAFIGGVCYMLCGIFIGNSQHLTYVISACWLPFVINYYLRIIGEKKYLNSVKCGLFLFLILTGGYPAFTIILFYLLAVFFVYHVVSILRKKDIRELFLFFGRNLLFVVITVLLSAGILLSVYQVFPFITRTNQFALDMALFGPFSPQSSVSFLLPFATVKAPDFFATDISMSNAYFGGLMFLFFLLSFFVKKPAYIKLLSGFALFSLAAAFGKYLPVRAFLFHYVPMMNVFRFPSVFRLFVITGFLLGALYWVEQFIKYKEPKMKRRVQFGTLFFILLFLGVMLSSRISGYLDMKNFIARDLFKFSKDSTIIQHLAFQAFVQLIVFGFFFLVIRKVSDVKKLLRYVTFLIVFDMLFAAQLNGPYTTYSDLFSAKESDRHIRKFPPGFPPLPDINIADVNPSEVYSGPFWRNVNIFQKQISGDGFNSFAFSGYEKLRDETPQLYSQVLKNKIVFLSDRVIDEKNISNYKPDSSFTSKALFFESDDCVRLQAFSLKHSNEDLAHLIHFAPDSFIVTTQTSEPQLLTLLQNNYTGWTAFVNDKPTEIYSSDCCLMSIVLPPGKNTVSFIYRNPAIKSAMILALATLCVCLLLLMADKFRSEFKVLE